MPTYKHPVAKALPPKKVTPVYPDTAAGAVQALKEMSTYRVRNPRATPDPCVQGVWKVEFDGVRLSKQYTVTCIVYLAGYKDPWGDIRQYDDFETLDIGIFARSEI